MIMFLGIGLALGNWISIAVLMAAVVIVYGYRVAVEERALAAVIGDPYRRYMTRHALRAIPVLKVISESTARRNAAFCGA